jgi:hypothetical protein
MTRMIILELTFYLANVICLINASRQDSEIEGLASSPLLQLS